MELRRIARSAWFAGPMALAIFTIAIAPSTMFGQGAQGQAGVVVDAKGVLRTNYVDDPSGELARRQREAAKAALNPRVQQKSKLRMISLNRLEKAIAKQLDMDRPPTDEMKNLAGLIRIQNVFFYPDSGDIVIAGPAEGWYTDSTGRVVGMETGRPVVSLEDLIIGLRAYAPGKHGPTTIGCSIDATPEGLAAMQKFLASVGTAADPSDPARTQFIVDGLRTSLGLQKVTILGIPANTHFAQVMVEADYRMKLIGIGLERPAVKLASYVERADPSSISRNAMQRWWFVPDYQCVRVSGDDLAMELVGNGVKLMGEDEMVATDGSRHVVKGTANRASMAFVTGFTQKYPELAAKTPVYAQLRNLIDIAVACAFIQQQDYYGRADWKMELLLDESKVKVQTHEAPVQVETAVASFWKGSRLLTPVGGGVTFHPEQALSPTNRLADDGEKVAKLRDKIELKNLAADQWWWD
jgi:hypothetical protein